MQTFKPTHIITVVSYDESVEKTRVMKVKAEDNGYWLFDEQEWKYEYGSDWEITEDGDILFQGAVPVCRSYWIEPIGEEGEQQ